MCSHKRAAELTVQEERDLLSNAAPAFSLSIWSEADFGRRGGCALDEPLRRNHLSYRHLIGSKWTAVVPIHCERHFVVSEWASSPRDCNDIPDQVILKAVTTGRRRSVLWRSLRNAGVWRIGWL